MTTLLVLIILIYGIHAENIEIIDLDNNNGYLPIKVDEVRLIEYNMKVLHIINITELEVARNQIEVNIKMLNETLPSDTKNDYIHRTLLRNFRELDTKLKALTPKIRNKRGLIDLLGKTLKVIAGTMDSEDEKAIYNALHNLDTENTELINENNKQIKINKELQEQIEILNKNILNIERYISSQIKSLVLNTQIREHYYYLKVCFQIHNDINSLLHFIDTIEDVILTSRLGILTRNILTDQETKLIESDEEFKNIDLVSLLYKHNIIIFTLLIPKYGKEKYEKYRLFEILDDKNETISFKHKEILLKDGIVYEFNEKSEKASNLVKLNDECIIDIFTKSIIKNCIRIKKKAEETIKIITPGSIVIQKFHKTKMKTTCGHNIFVEGTKWIKYKNCTLYLKNQSFTNVENTIKHHYLNPEFIKAIPFTNTTKEELTMEILDTKNVQNRNKIEKHQKVSNYHYTCLYLLISIIIILISYQSVKRFKLNLSSTPRTEPETSVGGVTGPPTLSAEF